MTVKAEKCKLGGAQVSYLGHVVGQGRRMPSEVKVEAVKSYRRPKTKTDVRAFLGITVYYHHYIKSYSELARPLTDALRKNEPTTLVWDEKKQESFQNLQSALVSRPILQAPAYNKSFIVQCDASDRGMGAVPCQHDEAGEEHPVVYISRELSVREQAYSASEKECACLVWATQKLPCYLAGSKFTFRTDHCPLKWVQNMSPKNG